MSEVDRREEPFWRKNNPVAYGVVLTAFVLVGYAVIGLREHCIGTNCQTNFSVFWNSDPNEIGDTLAGLFSALAFIWIITTVFLQSHELKEQRKEFREQRKATEDMAKAMAAQAAIFEDEMKQRKETYAAEQVKEVDKSLQSALANLVEGSLLVAFADGSEREERFQHLISRNYMSGRDIQTERTEQLLINVNEGLQQLLSEFQVQMRLRSSVLKHVTVCLRETKILLAQASPAVRMSHNSSLLENLVQTLENFEIE